MRWVMSFVVVGLVVLGESIPVAAQQFDSVMGERGSTTYGTITEITRSQITIETTQGKKQFAVPDIQKITFKGEPRELSRARDAVLRGQFENARSELEKLSLDGITRPEMLQDIAFYKALADGRLALVGGGDKGAAVKALRAFVESPGNQQSLHYYPAVELLGDLAIALGSLDNGIKYYGMLAEAPWPAAQMRGAVLEGKALQENGMYPAALAKFDSVLASPIDDARARDTKLLATLGRAVCLAATGQTQEGIALANEVIATNDSQAKPLLFARAYNALGNCYLLAKQPQDALLAFLHVDLLFNQDPDAHAEALSHLSSLWRALNQSERALQARGMLEERYSGSPWTNRK